MLATAIILATATFRSFDASGTPYFDGAADIDLVTQNVAMAADRADTTAGPLGTITVTTVHEFRVGAAEYKGRILIPRLRVGDEKSGVPNFKVKLTINGKPVKLEPIPKNPDPITSEMGVTARADEYANVDWAARSTFGVRTTYKVGIGRAGFEQKQRATAYFLAYYRPVRQTQVAIRFAPYTVFNLPAQFGESLPWQIGTTGAFVRADGRSWNGQWAGLEWYPPELY